MKIVKTLLLISLFICPLALSKTAPLPSDKARGLFVAIGGGPRLPVGGFANTSVMGYGLNIEFDYTDNEYLPLFLFGKVGIEHYPGSIDYYQHSDYSNYSVTLLPLTFGGRYYFKPIIENFMLILPHVEGAVHFAIYENLNQYKIDSGLPNFTENGSMFGFSIGGGVSMFMMEIAANYNFYQSYQYLSLDFKVRLPLFATI